MNQRSFHLKFSPMMGVMPGLLSKAVPALCADCHPDYWDNYNDYYHGAAYKRGATDAQVLHEHAAVVCLHLRLHALHDFRRAHIHTAGTGIGSRH